MAATTSTSMHAKRATASLASTAAEASKKTGARRTMYFVSRVKTDNAAVHADEYLPRGSYGGEWVDDKREGFGTQTYGNGDKYEGAWRANKPDGRGTYWKLVRPAGRAAGVKRKGDAGSFVKVYEGDYYDGQRHGSGRLYLDNGDIYEGTFVNGLREGQGTLRYVDGSVYNGQWFRDKRHGQGTLLHPNGDRYVGAWALDKKNGTGQYFYVSKFKSYVGEWVEDVAKCGEMFEWRGAEGSTAELPGVAASPLAHVAAYAAAHGSSSSFLSELTAQPFAGFIPLPELGLQDTGSVLRDAYATVRTHAREAGVSGSLSSHGSYAPSSSHTYTHDSYHHDGGRGEGGEGDRSPTGLGYLYSVEALSLDLSPDEIAQLTAAFRVGDKDASGRLPADLHALLEVLSALGIAAPLEDAQALLNELTSQEAEFQATQASVNESFSDFISFPVFAACMSRLRE